jgi:pimeloyl-ACP methyl ester carboxylesterase
VTAIESGPPRHDVPRNGRSGFALVDERQVHYLEWGPSAAPTVVCLHGGGQTAYMWEELGDALRERYHVLAPDLPWHGDSDPIDDMSRQTIAASMPALLAEFGVARAAFVGASLGGIVSLTLAAARPELVGAIALIDIGHRLEDEGVNRIIDFMTRHESFGSLEEAAAEVAEYLPQRKEVKVENLRRNLRQRADGRWEWKHAYGRRLREETDDVRMGGWRQLIAGLDQEITTLGCPVLVLRGKASDVLSDEGAEEVAALIPNARLARVSGAGHHAAGDNPESTVNLVRGFLDEVGW